MNAKLQKLVEMRRQLLAKLTMLELLMHGSFVERFSTCSRENCRCHRGEKHGPRAYVVVYRDGRQRQVYVPQAQLKVVAKALKQDAQAQGLLHQISECNLALMRAGVLDTSLRDEGGDAS